MESSAILKGWIDLQPPCGISGKSIRDDDYVVWFPSFITDKEDPFWQYNECPMLREAFDEWESKEAFLARWRKFLYDVLVPKHHILITRSDYLVLLGEKSQEIGLYFLAHGFTLAIPRKDWKRFESLILTPWHCRRLPLPNQWQISVCAEGDRMKLTWEPPSEWKGRRRDRILLDRLEWEALRETLRDVDRALVVAGHI